MALTEKQISSEKQELDILFSARRNDILELENVIKVSNAKIDKLKKDTIEAKEEYKKAQDQAKTAQEELKKCLIEAKNVKAEASKVLTIAKNNESRSREVLEEKEKDLAELQRGKSIIIKAKKQVTENNKESSRLEKEAQRIIDKELELCKLIEEQKEINSIKDSLDEKKEELNKTSKHIKDREKILDEAIKETEKERMNLKSEIKRYSSVTKETLEATKEYEAKNILKDKEIKEIEEAKIGNSEKYAKTVANLETKRKLLDAKEKKIDYILAKLKKDKKLTDDLKEIGLV